MAGKCEFQSRRHAGSLHGSDSWKRQFFEVGDRSQMAGEELARLARGLALEDRDISAAGKVFAIGTHEQRPQRMPSGLVDSRSKVIDQFLVEQIQRWICQSDQAESIRRFETHLTHHLVSADCIGGSWLPFWNPILD